LDFEKLLKEDVSSTSEITDTLDAIEMAGNEIAQSIVAIKKQLNPSWIN